MSQAMNAASSPTRRLSLLVGISFLYAVSFTVGTGVIPAWGRWYSPSLSYRHQVEGLLHGQLAISQAMADIDHDLVWHEGEVHQVWGLGVPLWRLPFEGLARLLGFPCFPDRLCFLCALWLWGIYALATLDRVALNSAWPSSMKRPELVLIGVFMLLLNPCFVSLCSTRFAVYEEACAYFYMCGTALLIAVVRFELSPSFPRLCLVALSAGMVPMVRPTLVFYGLFSLIICLYSAHSKGVLGKAAAWLLVGFLYSLGIGLLLGTNHLRFGAIGEFGHSLNVQVLFGSMYATRFDHPFRNASFVEAFRELLGSLFFTRKLNCDDYYASGVVAWQSGILRWREFYFTTFDGSWLGLWLIGAFSLWRRRVQPSRLIEWRSPHWGAVWASFGAVLVLSAFYLRNSVISSRYVSDFSPAFAVFSMVAAGAIVRRLDVVRPWMGRVAVGVVLFWWATRMAAIHEGYGPPTALPGSILAEKLIASPVESNRVWPGELAVGDANCIRCLPLSWPEEMGGGLLGIAYNGIGWDCRTGMTKPLVVLFVHKPEFLELEVSPVGDAQDPAASDFWIRPKLHLGTLRHVSSEEMDGGFRRVRFAIDSIGNFGDQPILLFLALGPPDGLNSSSSPFFVRAIRVRGAGTLGPGVL
jgi:hypothetical protein